MTRKLKAWKDFCSLKDIFFHKQEHIQKILFKRERERATKKRGRKIWVSPLFAFIRNCSRKSVTKLLPLALVVVIFTIVFPREQGLDVANADCRPLHRNLLDILLRLGRSCHQMFSVVLLSQSTVSSSRAAKPSVPFGVVALYFRILLYESYGFIGII